MLYQPYELCTWPGMFSYLIFMVLKMEKYTYCSGFVWTQDLALLPFWSMYSICLASKWTYLYISRLFQEYFLTILKKHPSTWEQKNTFKFHFRPNLFCKFLTVWGRWILHSKLTCQDVFKFSLSDPFLKSTWLRKKCYI